MTEVINSTPISKEDLATIEKDLNGVFTTPGFVASVDLNCSEDGDEIVVELIHSTGLSIGEGSFEILKDDNNDSIFDACEETFLDILAEARDKIRPSALRRIMALYDLDTMLASLAKTKRLDDRLGELELEV